MISFRYHIVSIVAVFLALALGIVVGTPALNGPITKDLLAVYTTIVAAPASISRCSMATTRLALYCLSSPKTVS